MIRYIAFLDVSTFTAHYEVRYKKQLDQGLLPLRDFAGDLPILEEWKSAKALLNRIRAGAAAFFDNQTPELGRAWIESLPPGAGTPWLQEDDASFVRTRTCIVPSPKAISFSGDGPGTVMLWGCINVVDHLVLCSEVNHGDTPRVHLIVDVVRP